MIKETEEEDERIGWTKRSERYKSKEERKRRRERLRRERSQEDDEGGWRYTLERDHAKPQIRFHRDALLLHKVRRKIMVI